MSRHPRKVNDSDELAAADLLDTRQTVEAMKGSSISTSPPAGDMAKAAAALAARNTAVCNPLSNRAFAA